MANEMQRAMDEASEGKVTDELKRLIAGAIKAQAIDLQKAGAAVTSELGSRFERLSLMDPNDAPPGEYGPYLTESRKRNREKVRRIINRAITA